MEGLKVVYSTHCLGAITSLCIEVRNATVFFAMPDTVDHS